MTTAGSIRLSTKAERAQDEHDDDNEPDEIDDIVHRMSPLAQEPEQVEADDDDDGDACEPKQQIAEHLLSPLWCRLHCMNSQPAPSFLLSAA